LKALSLCGGVFCFLADLGKTPRTAYEADPERQEPFSMAFMTMTALLEMPGDRAGTRPFALKTTTKTA
jgi:hypothetical protein|tara:strand:- start:1508 stop:1711 length:204 start_codon:yes stop_codon:yes gene_type:complete